MLLFFFYSCPVRTSPNLYFHIQERAAYEVDVLQKALDESVSLSELERANKEYTELTVKYRDLLQRDSHLVQRSNNLEHLEVD